MQVQVSQSKDGSIAVNFDAGGRRETVRYLRDGEEKLIGFIPLTENDSGIQALAAVASMAIEAAHGNDVPLEGIMQKIFEIGVETGKKAKNN